MTTPKGTGRSFRALAEAAARFDCVRRRFATLCQDCDCITESGATCLVCGSQALMSLATVLNRGEKEAKA